jgi:hypothetical protein
MVIIKRIPFFIWVIASIAGLSVATAWLLGVSDVASFERHKDVFAMAVASIGVIMLAVQIHAQANDNRIANEYLNQPDFSFTQFGTGECKLEVWTPQRCGPSGNLNRCNEIHWFNVQHDGRLPARDIRVGLFHFKEHDVSIESRWIEKEILYPGDTLQFKLPPYSIPYEHYSENQNSEFMVLMSYTSPYSGVQYKRRYRMDYTPDFDYKKPKINDWTERVSIFDVALENMRDSLSIEVQDIFRSWFSRLMRTMTGKKEISVDEWLNNF